MDENSIDQYFRRIYNCSCYFDFDDLQEHSKKKMYVNKEILEKVYDKYQTNIDQMKDKKEIYAVCYYDCNVDDNVYSYFFEDEKEADDYADMLTRCDDQFWTVVKKQLICMKKH